MPGCEVIHMYVSEPSLLVSYILERFSDQLYWFVQRSIFINSVLADDILYWYAKKKNNSVQFFAKNK